MIFQFDIGTRVANRHNTKEKGTINRVYPFREKPYILVKWDTGRLHSYFHTDLVKE